MLTKLRICNLKRFDEAEIDLGQAVVFVGPNNSGKTTALQALALWEIGVRRWAEKRGDKSSATKRSGAAINRRDLIAMPVPSAKLLWRDLHVRNVTRVVDDATGQRKPKTAYIRTKVTVDGITGGHAWSCGLEFDYANEESLYCRPLSEGDGKRSERKTIPREAIDISVAFLPPMSGLAAEEPKWEQGRVNVLIGEGQTAQVLRNLCYEVYASEERAEEWNRLVVSIRDLFGVELLPPTYIAERGEITMSYKETGGAELDLSSSGRGLQQTLLLLSYLYANPRTVLLLDEPDAHLEILRQRQIYQLLTTVAEEKGSQIIAASHSEVVLNEACDRGVAVAFVGAPHRIADRGSQVLKALRDIGFDQYYQAEQTGWVLYLEDSTDLAILQAFAKTLDHEAQAHLERPFLHRVATNQPQRAREHFYGLQEAKHDLVGIALFDRLDKELEEGRPLRELMWERREIESYFCMEEVLVEYARYDLPDDLFGQAESEKRVATMREVITEIGEALERLGKPDPWSGEIKASDDFLDPVFRGFFKKLGLPLGFRKSDYHRLAALVPRDRIDLEVVEKLDAIVGVAKHARPREG